MTSPSPNSGIKQVSIQVLNISVFVIPSKRKGAKTLSCLTHAISVVLHHLFQYFSHGVGFQIGDQLLSFTSLWSIQLSSIYTLFSLVTFSSSS